MFDKPAAFSENAGEEKRPSVLAGEACRLCGQPLTSYSEKEKDLQFCCPGCRQVFSILSDISGQLPENFRETDIFRACLETGIIPGNNTFPGVKPPKAEVNDAALSLTFRVEGMWCPACAWLIEEVLRKKTGIDNPHVSFFSDTVRLHYLPHMVSPAEIEADIKRLGYRTNLLETGDALLTMRNDLLTRLGVSAILTANIMMLSFALYFGFIQDFAPHVATYFSYPLFVLSTPVVFYGGMPILRKAWAGLRFCSLSMDTLITVSVLSAFLYSLIQMIRGSIHLYFDTASMLITIVLLGRYIEMQARNRALTALPFEELDLRKARLKVGQGERWIETDDVKPGDRLVVEKGERIPLDGDITAGGGLIDQSVLTGEPAPVAKQINEQVMAGSLLVDGELEVTTKRPARENYLRQIKDIAEHALERKNAGEELADSISRFFVPAILGVAFLTAIVLWSSGSQSDRILLRCLTVLLIACPCALGIAMPLVKVVIIGLGHKKGILIKNPRALERIDKIDAMVLDKTGTITEGQFTLRQVISFGIDEDKVLPMIAAIEAQSAHFLAQEIMRRTKSAGFTMPEASALEEFQGLGISGTVDGKIVFAGNRRFLSRSDAGLSSSIDRQAQTEEQKGMTVVFFGSENTVQGFFVFGDPLKKDARRFVDWLKQRSIKVLLLSGDGVMTTEAVAGSLGISDFLGQTLPEEKAESIRVLQRQGYVVGMVGDGVNDVAALAQADVGFSMGPGYNLMREASDLTILSGRLETIIETFALSRLSIRTIRQNLSFAFFYNIIAIPVAAIGLLNPLIAVTAMFLSSLTVMGNSIRATKIGGKAIVCKP